ncbi:hypothetical protein KL950_003952 [Ogataea haglerorum]|nr:hypothetical protein KL950_003952 [Ogataea haglerorum]
MLSFGGHSNLDIQTSLKKACTADSAAPKRKHVRACIVYTWDHKSSREFWHCLKLLPIQSNDTQIFKTLIVIHKVLQEGHPTCLIGGYKNINWLESLGRFSNNDTTAGHTKLIREYVFYLEQKLRFHHDHRGFNGMFEYEEYVSLRTVSDPNEGFESIMDLLSLQDSLDNLQRVIFSFIRHTSDISEYIISSLVPIIAESYGIYKFLISMLRALYRSSESDEVIAPLKDRFDAQHHRLFEFYADCSSIKIQCTAF